MTILKKLKRLLLTQISFVEFKKTILVLLASLTFSFASTQNDIDNNSLLKSEQSQLIQVEEKAKDKESKYPKNDLRYRNKRRSELSKKLELEQNWNWRSDKITQVLNSNKETEFYINHRRRTDSKPIEIYDSEFNRIDLESNYFLRNEFRDNINFPYIVLFNENREYGIYNLEAKEFSIEPKYVRIAFLNKNYVKIRGETNKSSSESIKGVNWRYGSLKRTRLYGIADPEGNLKTEFKYTNIDSPTDSTYLCYIQSKDSTINKVKELNTQAGIFENDHSKEYFDDEEIIVLNANLKAINNKRYIHFEKVFYWDSTLYEEGINFIATELQENGLHTYILDSKYNILLEIPYGQFYSRVKGKLDGLLEYHSKDSVEFHLVNDYTTERVLKVPHNFKPIPKKDKVYYKLSGEKGGYFDQVIYDETGKKLFECPDNKYLTCGKEDDYFLAVTRVSQNQHVEKFAYLYDLKGKLLIWHGKFKYDETLKKRYILGTKGEVFYLSK